MINISIVAFIGYLILVTYLGYLIGIIHASIVALKENKKDKEDLDKMTEILAKMTLTLESLLNNNKEQND